MWYVRQTTTAAADGEHYLLGAIARYKVARLDWLLSGGLGIREYFSGVQIMGDLPVKFLQRPAQGLYYQLPLVAAFGRELPLVVASYVEWKSSHSAIL
jgi:hypothetical protein